MKVTQLWSYPVKSCVGMRLDETEVDSWGIVGDRGFVIATWEGRVLTQKSLAQLNLISAAMTQRTLTLSAPGMQPLVIDLRVAGPPTHVNLFDGPAPGEYLGAVSADWLTDFIGQRCRLVRSNRTFPRRMGSRAAHLFLEAQQRFPDASPLHLIGQASLDD